MQRHLEAKVSSDRKAIKNILALVCNSPWMKEHLIRGWELQGCTVVTEVYGQTMGREWHTQGARDHAARNARWRELATRMASQGGLDLVFMVAYDDVLEAETLRHFRAVGAKLVLFHVDMPTQWYRIIRSARYCDLICHAHDDYVGYFRRHGVPLHSMPMAANPPPEEPRASLVRYDGVVFLGSPWPYRQRVLQKLAAAGVPLRIYGHSWDLRGGWPAIPGMWRKTAHDAIWYLAPRLSMEGPKILGQVADRYFLSLARPKKPAVQVDRFPPGIVQGRYPGEQLAALVRGAAVNIGFTQCGTDAMAEFPRQIRLREFEIPMLGGFYLVQNCQDLGRYYKIGEEVAAWETGTDVAEQCRYYLAHPEERLRIAAAGRRRALADHTWRQRFRSLAERLGMKLP